MPNDYLIYQDANGEGLAPIGTRAARWADQAAEGRILTADTLEDLIAQIDDIDQEAALATIQRYNEYCETGVDEEYHQDASELFSLLNGPFYATSYESTNVQPLTILGGIRTNSKLQVCDGNDDPIEGLYCVGSMIGDFYSGGYTFFIGGLNLGSTCGALPYVLGKELAAE